MAVCRHRAVVVVSLLVLCSSLRLSAAMTRAEKREYKERVVEMFHHAYNSYMGHAYPADELMPLSCRGRVRGRERSRGDIDECLGSFSLTLVDSLDTLAVIGDIAEFSRAVRMVLIGVQFDADLTVSVFETNIRMLGGLLGAHFVAEALKADGHPELQWYNGDLVKKADQLGQKLLPAFNTTTGLPYPRINLKHGLNSTSRRPAGDTTCTACAGTMLMEFAALSRLTGNPDYELKARHAMEVIWQRRHRDNNLVGTIINVHNGEWMKRESGVGAGIDSYYEYCLKSYVLLGDKEYLRRFRVHYEAIKRYISSGPLLLEVNMNSPQRFSRMFMDSLLAFWPGLQVLWGDLNSAIHTHDMLYHVAQRHKFLPEAFTTEFKVQWPNHPLRPEFIESTYFLFQATQDPYYLDIGKAIVDNLNHYTRVKCGFAAIKDVRTYALEDRMDSYVLAEVFKYLYLLFAEEEDLTLDMDQFIFTTEAHLLPISLTKYMQEKTPTVTTPQPPTRMTPSQQGEAGKKEEEKEHKVSDGLHLNMCPRVILVHSPMISFLKMVLKQCSRSRFIPARLRSSLDSEIHMSQDQVLTLQNIDFGNKEHLTLLADMGIMLDFQDGGKVMLIHRADKAKSKQASQNGLQLLQEIIRVTKLNANASQEEVKMLKITQPESHRASMLAGGAKFGPQLGGESRFQISGELVLPISPLDGCDLFDDDLKLKGKIPLIMRGGCMFIHKVRNAQRAGAIAAVIYDHLDDTSEGQTSPPFPFFMSSDGNDDVAIPSVFIMGKDGRGLRNLLKAETVYVLLTSPSLHPEQTDKGEGMCTSEGSKGFWMEPTEHEKQTVCSDNAVRQGCDDPTKVPKGSVGSKGPNDIEGSVDCKGPSDNEGSVDGSSDSKLFDSGEDSSQSHDTVHTPSHQSRSPPSL